MRIKINTLIYLFILFIYIFNEDKTHLANIKLFYHVALRNIRNIYKKDIYMTYIK